MRRVPTILHLDMDAFYASVEQAAKPSLRGRPVVVGGLGARGVVATASYEARVFGVRSAMATAHARRLCPNAAYLVPRFPLYRQVSETVMGLLRELSPLVEPLSLDEAFVDLEAGPYGELLRSAGPEAGAGLARAVGEDLRADILAATGLSGSVGLAGVKYLAKIASEQAKPDGLVLITPGTEREVLDPLPVRALPGVGPATAELLRREGLATVADVAALPEQELVRLLGRAHGAAVHALARGRDDRPVVADRDAKSVSVEDTFETDLVDRDRIAFEVDRLAERCVGRLRGAGRTGRTIVLKVRRYDFTTLTRSETLRAPTDDPAVIRGTARRLLEQVESVGGVRLLGVGVSGLADFAQEDLFAQQELYAPQLRTGGAGGPAGAGGAAAGAAEGPLPGGEAGPGQPGAAAEEDPAVLPAGTPGGTGSGRRWSPGQDVRHREHGAGWVQGSGLGRVTVRFETPGSPPGRVFTFPVDDPALEPADPLPLPGVRRPPTPRQAPLAR